jgi:cell division protein DivIC
LAKRLKLKANIKQKLVAFFLLLIFAFISSILVSQTGQLKSQTAKLNALDEQIAVSRQRNNELISEKEKISTDEYKKDIAKTRDGLVYPNEIIFVDSLAAE